MQILNHRQIQQKIRRLAYQILENNIEEREILLLGINNNGMSFAKMIYAELTELSNLAVKLISIKLNPAAPTSDEVVLEIPVSQLENKTIILIDDVANTGRTLFYAMKPIFQVIPKKVEVAVLVDRMHKSFPIKIDYVGLSLATTLKENIDVQIRDVEEHAVFLN
jgi:pyrimidine operon attenuation protein/uracil phosphoribosyltransferase